MIVCFLQNNALLYRQGQYSEVHVGSTQKEGWNHSPIFGVLINEVGPCFGYLDVNMT